MSRVAHREHDVRARHDRDPRVLARVSLGELGAEGLDGEPAADRHRVARVEHEIEQHLRQLARIGLDEAGRRAQPELERGLLAEGAPEHELEAAHRLVEIEHPGPQHLPAAERQELTGDRRRPFRGGADLLHVLSRQARELGPPEQEVGGAQDHGHLIVRLVRHAAGQLAHDLEALALAGALLDLPPGGLVGVHLEHALGPALGIAPQDPLRGDVESAPVLGDVHELALPLAMLQQRPIDLGQRHPGIRSAAARAPPGRWPPPRTTRTAAPRPCSSS